MLRSENIQVALRFRPLNFRETIKKDPEIWEIEENMTFLKPSWSEKLLDSRKISISKSYTYNHCFSSQDSNTEVYTNTSKKIVEASLQGYNGTIIAYGQTGSGKTYTMMGSDSAALDKILDKSSEKIEIPYAKGIIILALEDLLRLTEENKNKPCYLSCSYLEIYNEQIYDLLADNDKITETLITQEDKGRGFYIRGLSEHVINSINDVEGLIKKGESNRHYAATAMNHQSSRSHTIFRIYVTSVAIISSNETSENITTESLLNFVDLAGSERVCSLQEAINPIETTVGFRPPRSPRTSKLRSSSSRRSIDTFVNEGKHINVSLFYLCQVISKLSQKNISDVHIPYRNSNLTKILSTSLGGNALTCIICTATSTLSQFELTLSTLRFGGIVGSIQNVIKANVRSDKTNELLLIYQKDIEDLRQKLSTYENEGRVSNNDKSDIRRTLEERIKLLTSMLFSRHKNEDEPKDEELWSEGAGDLIIDTKLVTSRKTSDVLNTSSDFAFLRMKEMHKEMDKQHQYIEELLQKNQYLTDSKENVIFIQLTNNLKKSLQICQTVTEKKKLYKLELKKKKERAELINSKLVQTQQRLEIVEKFVGMDKLNDSQLEEIEKLYYKGLDMVKNIRIQKKYVQEILSLREIIDKNCKTPEDQENLYKSKTEPKDLGLNGSFT
jgi:Kinesin motor domain